WSYPGPTAVATSQLIPRCESWTKTSTQSSTLSCVTGSPLHSRDRLQNAAANEKHFILASLYGIWRISSWHEGGSINCAFAGNRDLQLTAFASFKQVAKSGEVMTVASSQSNPTEKICSQAASSWALLVMPLHVSSRLQMSFVN